MKGSPVLGLQGREHNSSPLTWFGCHWRGRLRLGYGVMTTNVIENTHGHTHNHAGIALYVAINGTQN